MWHIAAILVFLGFPALADTYVKVNRITGQIINTANLTNPERDLTKRIVWMLLEDAGAPSHDPETETISRNVSIPDVSDLQTSVPEDAKVMVSYLVITRTVGDIAAAKNARCQSLADQNKETIALIAQLHSQTEPATRATYVNACKR